MVKSYLYYSWGHLQLKSDNLLHLCQEPDNDGDVLYPEGPIYQLNCETPRYKPPDPRYRHLIQELRSNFM